MKRHFRFGLAAVCTFLLAGAVGMFWAHSAAAQLSTNSLQTVGAITQLPADDPRQIAVRIINIALSLIGVIMVVLIIYAGFLYMTAGGNTEQVDKAKRIIRDAIIGVIIILSSWAITTFVIRSLLQATGGGGGVTTQGTGSGLGGGLGGGGAFSQFRLESITPAGSVPNRNIEVRFLFTQDVEPASVSSTIRVVRHSTGTPVAGNFSFHGSEVAFVPAAACPAPNGDRFCFDGDTDFDAIVSNTLSSVGGQRLVCGGFAPPCTETFHTGNLIDTNGPATTILEPLDGQSVPTNSSVLIATRAADESGVSYVESSIDGHIIGRDTPSVTSTPQDFTAHVIWNTAGVTTGTHAVRSIAHDIDHNQNETAANNVVVRLEHCFNGARDVDESDVDCGGTDCGACSGGSCTESYECASGVCTAGRCVVRPIITEVQPGNGGPKTYITIRGVNFGSSPGKVAFFNNQPASAPSACGPTARTWTDNQVVVEVPTGALNGPLTLLNVSSSLIDATNDDSGPRLEDFQVTTSTHPGLCSADPNHGPVSTVLTLNGVGLGGTSDRVQFGDALITTFRSWGANAIQLVAPVVSPGSYQVYAQVGADQSNPVQFEVEAPVVSEVPVIELVDPVTGPIGQYITLQGRNFGDTAGLVYFSRTGIGSGPADTEFPAACSANNSFWRRDRIVVKVPDQIGGLGPENAVTPGSFEVYVRRQEDRAESNRIAFNVGAGEPGPGVCAIEPAVGPVGASTTIYGERLGTAPGRITFSSAPARVDATDFTDWGTGQIQTKVPERARTGLVKVITSVTSSNGILFTVQNCAEHEGVCSADERCCPDSGVCVPASGGGACPVTNPEAHYAWRMSTGALPLNPEVVEECDPASLRLPSPSPWNGRPGGNKVCVNADLVVRLTTPLREGSVSPSSFIVRRCPDTGSCTGGTPVRAAAGSPNVLLSSDNQGRIRFTPDGGWTASSTYEIVLTTGIQSDTGLSMLENAETCGAGNAYCFKFNTKTTEEPCQVGSVIVEPNPYTFDDIGLQQGTEGVPLAAEDACIALDGSRYDWHWTTSDGRITVTNNPNPAHPELHDQAQIAESFAETGEDPVRVSGAVSNAGTVTTGISSMYVRLVPPKVVAKGPECDSACVNADIWMRFNQLMDRATFNTGSHSNVILKRCTNENCLVFDQVRELDTRLFIWSEVFQGGVSTTLVRTNHPDAFDQGRFYKVVLKSGVSGGIRARNHMPLVNLNDPEGFSWKFHTLSGEHARCPVDSVTVEPGEKIETAVGDRQFFSADPVGVADSCNPTGQPLISDQSFDWHIENGDVARFINGSGADFLRTTASPAAGCSAQCTKLGADGVFGHVASCGNGIIETTDDQYCVAGRTPNGDRCTLMDAGSQAGEECEPSSPTDPLCDPLTCLWPGVHGGTCGNALLDRGEQCDPLVCHGGAHDGESCTGGDTFCGAPSSCTTTASEIYGCSNNCQMLGGTAYSTINPEVAGLCGNGSRGLGEACDLGTANGTGGCTSDCLHAGSGHVNAVCGNGILEPGEQCDLVAGAWPAGCSHETCLRTGTDACPAGAIHPTLCCGNSTVDPGEDCDGTDGCTARCLYAGSSSAYATPSFCGDGVAGVGEDASCDPSVVGPARLVGASQLAEITGLRDPLPEENGRLLTPLHATYQGKTGDATYGLQCGFTRENQCRVHYGLTEGGCCALRPVPALIYPTNHATSVCRNAQVTVEFNEPVSAESVQHNFFLATTSTGTVCPSGTQRLEDTPLAGGFRAWLADLWHHVVAFFTASSAQADVWCIGSVPGEVQLVTSSTAIFALQNALATSTQYRIIVRGDTDLASSTRHGVRSERGVSMDGVIQWDFTTGNKICAANQLTVNDESAEHPYYFNEHPETHLFQSNVQSVQDGVVVPIVPVSDYHWRLRSWMSSDETVLRTTALSFPTLANVTEQNVNGNSFISTSLLIDVDHVNDPTTSGTSMETARNAKVMLCQNPWPSLDLAPFEDMQNGKAFRPVLSGGLEGVQALSGGPFFNFSFMYCRDSGTTSTADDMPGLVIKGVPLSAGDRSAGILRQYFLTYPDAAPGYLRGDGIGVRVMSNPNHYSPQAWYDSRGFSGSPVSQTIDGYEALKDGDTLYVSAFNTDNVSRAPVYSNIYVFSRNPDAKDVTQNIFDQLVKSLAFNVNLSEEISNKCYTGPASPYETPDGRTISCSADWECARYGTSLHCASFKEKIQRDLVRVRDFTSLMGVLADAKTRDGKFPVLTGGTFLRGLTNSLWPSWQNSFSSALQSGPPTDPVNKFLTCGYCKHGADLTSTPCMQAADCIAGDECVAQVSTDPADARNGYDPATCWNATSSQYLCPSLSSALTSRLYQYRSLNNGTGYELGTELEGPAIDRYSPPMISGGIKRCSNTLVPCTERANCAVTSTTGLVLSQGECNPTGGVWIYSHLCRNEVYGTDSICGNGIIGDHESCELGQTNPAACTTASGQAGTKLQICNDCTGWTDGPDTSCVPNVQCGNGRIDRDPVTGVPEACDDGPANGTYGRCNRTCTGIGANCGDGMLSLGETCDNGAPGTRHTIGGASIVGGNGDYSGFDGDLASSCGMDCHSQAPHCGDGAVNGPEQCDGNNQQTTLSLCITGDPTPCRSNTDCGPGGVCGLTGGTGTLALCENVRIGRCAGGTHTGQNCSTLLSTYSADETRLAQAVGDLYCGPGISCIPYATAHNRTCKPSGTSNQCTWNDWTSCLPLHSCGDGSIDTGEECDNGTANHDHGACTTQCKRNVCGDGNISMGVEECDFGSRNGLPCTGAEYGSTCISCSATCHMLAGSGGFCGNNIREASEQCDGRDVPTGISCRGLGYDYAQRITIRCTHPEFFTDSSGVLQCIYPNTYVGHPENRDTCAHLGFVHAYDPSPWVYHGAASTPQVMDSRWLQACTAQVRQDILTCTPTCGFGGCSRCGDTLGTGTISARVFDAVYSATSTPAARVTLFNHGIRVSETFTAEDGSFTFTGLDNHAECTSYSITVDKTDNNPHTPDNEGVNGGYWPYESTPASVSTFLHDGIQNNDGKIFLIPRVAVDETLVVHTWNGSLNNWQGSGINRYILSHLIVPAYRSYGWTITGSIRTYGPVAWSTDGHGVRDIKEHDRGDLQGDPNVSNFPYAHLFCQGDVNGNCYRVATGPQATKYKFRHDIRQTPSDTSPLDTPPFGYFSYFLTDQRVPAGSLETPFNLYNDTQSVVSIVTHDRIYRVTPPQPSIGTLPTCFSDGPYSHNQKQGKYWLVFQQNAADGSITINTSYNGAYLCGGDPIPNESSQILPYPGMTVPRTLLEYGGSNPAIGDVFNWADQRQW